MTAGRSSERVSRPPSTSRVTVMAPPSTVSLLAKVPCFGAGREAHADSDDFGYDALFLEADGFFDSNFVEGVHRHLDAAGLDAGAVGLDADFDVVIDDPLDWNEELHCCCHSFCCCARRRARFGEAI